MNPGSDPDAPGSEISTADGDIDGTATQLTEDDTLDDTGVEDPLDRGYSPPDREPAVRLPMTPEDARRGETLDERLAEEREEDEGGASSRDPDRAGRLYETGDPLTARDAGVDGAAASAEEAAMHRLPD